MATSKNLDHIIFDLSEVCMNGLMNLPDRIMDSVFSKNLDIVRKTYSEYRDEFFDIDRDNGIGGLFRGRTTEESFFDSYLGAVGYPLSVEELMNITRKNFEEFHEMVEVLESLKRQGYELNLLSDHGKEWIRHIEDNFDFMKIFNNKIYSFDSGYVKSEKAAFDYAIEKIGIKPREKTLFVDDRWKNCAMAIISDVSGARISNSYNFKYGSENGESREQLVKETERLKEHLERKFDIDLAA